VAVAVVVVVVVIVVVVVGAADIHRMKHRVIVSEHEQNFCQRGQ
jgi:hypothetical protein